MFLLMIDEGPVRITQTVYWIWAENSEQKIVRDVDEGRAYASRIRNSGNGSWWIDLNCVKTRGNTFIGKVF